MFCFWESCVWRIIGWLFGQRIVIESFMVGWFVGWWVGCLVGWLLDCLLVGLLVWLLVDRQTDRQTRGGGPPRHP